MLDAFTVMPVAFLYKSFDSAPDDALAYLLAYGHSDPVPIGLIPADIQNQQIIRKRFSSFIYSSKFRVLSNIVFFNFQFLLLLFFCNAEKGHICGPYAVNLFLPLSLLLLRTFLPEAVAILFLKPCSLLLCFFFGW